MRIRAATRDDANDLARLLSDYLREGYPCHIGSTADQLRRDVLSAAPLQQVLLAEQSGHSVGFVAWNPVYDMHWAVAGAQVADLYVAPPYRGRGIALALLAQLAADVRAEGGAFLRGGAYDRQSTRKFYGRIAVIAPSGETHLSGRAFRHLADLAGKPVREMVRDLPLVAWNFEV